MVQRLRFCAPSTGGLSSIPGQGILCIATKAKTWCSQLNKNIFFREKKEQRKTMGSFHSKDNKAVFLRTPQHNAESLRYFLGLSGSGLNRDLCHVISLSGSIFWKVRLIHVFGRKVLVRNNNELLRSPFQYQSGDVAIMRFDQKPSVSWVRCFNCSCSLLNWSWSCRRAEERA